LDAHLDAGLHEIAAGNVLGLSRAGAVRLVDRPEHENLAARSRSVRDGRAIELALTRAGRRVCRRILSSRDHRWSVRWAACPNPIADLPPPCRTGAHRDAGRRATRLHRLRQ